MLKAEQFFQSDTNQRLAASWDSDGDYEPFLGQSDPRTRLIFLAGEHHPHFILADFCFCPSLCTLAINPFHESLPDPYHTPLVPKKQVRLLLHHSVAPVPVDCHFGPLGPRPYFLPDSFLLQRGFGV